VPGIELKMMFPSVLLNDVRLFISIYQEGGRLMEYIFFSPKADSPPPRAIHLQGRRRYPWSFHRMIHYDDVQHTTNHSLSMLSVFIQLK